MSQSPFKGAMGFAAIGFVGILLKNYYLAEYHPTYDLQVSNEAIKDSPEAMKLFSKLGKYKHYHPEAYEHAVEYCDRLLFLIKRLHQGALPGKTDIEDAGALVNVCYFYVMEHEASIIGSAEDACIFQREKEKLRTFLLKQLSDVLRLCKRLKLPPH